MLDPHAGTLPAGALPDSFEYIVRGRIVVPSAVLELHDYRFGRPQQALFESPYPFLDLALSARPGSPSGHYLDSPLPAARLGDLIFIPAGQRLRSAWGQGAQRSVTCRFDTALGPAAPRSWSAAELQASLDIRSPFVRDTLTRLACEIEAPGFCSELMAEALCTQLTIELGRYFRNVQPATNAPHRRLTPPQMRTLEELLDAPGKPPCASVLAAQCGVSTRHFFRMFHASTGMTLTDYAARSRVARAKTMLVADARPIKQIAHCCGFQTQAAFSAAFRRATGASPRAFRRAAAH